MNITMSLVLNMIEIILCLYISYLGLVGSYYSWKFKNNETLFAVSPLFTFKLCFCVMLLGILFFIGEIRWIRQSLNEPTLSWDAYLWITIEAGYLLVVGMVVHKIVLIGRLNSVDKEIKTLLQ